MNNYEEKEKESSSELATIIKSLGTGAGFLFIVALIYEAIKWVIILGLGIWIVSWVMDLITIAATSAA